MNESSRVVPAPEIVERALELSRADGCVVLADESTSANLRWANNTLTTNGVLRSRAVTVIAMVDGAEGTSTGVLSRSAVTADEIEGLVRAAEAAARSAEPAEDAAPLVAGTADAGWDDVPAETSIRVFDAFTPALGDVFARARSAGRISYGYVEHDVTTTYLGTSTGVRKRHVQPGGEAGMTGKSADLQRSAWVGAHTRDFTDVDPHALDEEIARRLGWASRRSDLPAGRYSTILPPTAVADLFVYAYWEMAARDANDGRTVYSKPGAGTRVGDRLGPPTVRLFSDPSYPGLECAPFVVSHASSAHGSVFDNGMPAGRTEWVSQGELSALVQTRASAALTGLPMTAGVDNLVLDAGGSGSVDDLVARTDRGLLVTCLWYIREVDPQTLLLTGLTRDGVYLVEDGEVTGAVNNFRFNESPIDILGRFDDAGATVPGISREWGEYFPRTAMAPLRVPDFNMSTVSAAL